jgi:ATP-dependent Clp protease ATP-binding subunit ClpC
MSVLCTAEADRILKAARTVAGELGHEYVGTEHLLLAVLSCGPRELRRELAHLNVTADRVRQVLMSISDHESNRATSNLPWSPRAKEVLCEALRLTGWRGVTQIDAWCLVNALFSAGVESRGAIAKTVSAVADVPDDDLAPIVDVVRAYLTRVQSIA